MEQVEYKKFGWGFQQKWKGDQFFEKDALTGIGKNVKLHGEIYNNPRSSAAACVNVLGSLAKSPDSLKEFLNEFNLRIDEIIEFPTGINLAGEVYDDQGNIVYEWIGPKKSPIHEVGGSRGEEKTSIDAFFLAMIDGKLTQILIEWKFIESYLKPENLNLFRGIRGNERLRRYSTVLAELRRKEDFPFKMTLEEGWGLNDLGYEPIYQLLRMTLLAKKTTPQILNENLTVEDYRIVHLTHSQNDALNTLPPNVLTGDANGLMKSTNNLHQLWSENILTETELAKFKFGYWDNAINVISEIPLRDYLTERYK